ncbi:MAG: hypothetical protein H0W62_06165 [Chitinophagales bacterium]|nr:hypothetical protein [Chitinophagales bacterium]
MKKIILLLVIATAYYKGATAQEIIKGLTNTASLIPKSQRVPSIKNKDGSTLVLSYAAGTGIKVMIGKNGKNNLFCDPFQTASMVQVGEKDVDGDGKQELLVGSRDSAKVNVMLYKKADFESEYKYWTTVHGENSVEFPGDGSVKLHDFQADGTTYKFGPSGDLLEAK